MRTLRNGRRRPSRRAPSPQSAAHATVATPPSRRVRRLSNLHALILGLGLWLVYTGLNTWYPGPLWMALLGALPGLVGLAVLRAAGISWWSAGLRGGPLSCNGALVLAPLLLFIPIALLARGGAAREPSRVLLYAPLSGVEQELFFRTVLLSLLLRTNPARPGYAVTGQACAFGLWHLRAVRVTPAPIAGAVLLGTALAGGLWGWQVRRDRTVIYAVGEHALLLLVP